MKKYYKFVVTTKKSSLSRGVVIILKSKNFKKSLRIGVVYLYESKFFCFINNTKLKRMCKENVFVVSSGDEISNQILGILQSSF